MTIKIIKPVDTGFNYAKTIFQVKGNENEFYMYIQDKYNMPRGKVVVKKGKVIDLDMPFKNDIKKIFKYWPYLFDSNNIDQKSAKGVQIKYLNRTEVAGRKLPSELKITTNEMVLNIKINYGN